MTRRCVLCGAPGSKAMFKVPAKPTESVLREQWLHVISKVTNVTEERVKSLRICYRHFAQEQLEQTPAGKCCPKGLFSSFISIQDQVFAKFL